MRAKVKATGEIVEVKPYGMMNISIHAYKTDDNRLIPSTALEFKEIIDWEQRKYDLVKAALHGSLETMCRTELSKEDIVKNCIAIAEEMLNYLKEE